MVSSAVLFHYTLSRHILSDRKLLRLLPRLIRELQRDLFVPWNKRLQKELAEPLFIADLHLRVFVITLEASEARFVDLRSSLQVQEIVYDTVLAVNGMLEFNKSDLHEFAGKKRISMLTHNSGDLFNMRSIVHEKFRFGCFLTHINLWKELHSSEAKYRVILEDDVSISPTFDARVLTSLNSLPASWDLLYLGSTAPNYGGRFSESIYQLRGALGTFGYIISQAGASKMLEAAKHSDKPVDHVLDSAMYTGRVSAFHVVPSIVKHRDDLESTLAYVH